jgi:hypothetical protein
MGKKSKNRSGKNRLDNTERKIEERKDYKKGRYVSKLRSTRIGEKLRGLLVYYEDAGGTMPETLARSVKTQRLLPENNKIFKTDVKLKTKRKQTSVDQGKDGVVVQNGLKDLIP